MPTINTHFNKDKPDPTKKPQTRADWKACAEWNKHECKRLQKERDDANKAVEALQEQVTNREARIETQQGQLAEAVIERNGLLQERDQYQHEAERVGKLYSHESEENLRLREQNEHVEAQLFAIGLQATATRKMMKK